MKLENLYLFLKDIRLEENFCMRTSVMFDMHLF